MRDALFFLVLEGFGQCEILLCAIVRTKVIRSLEPLLANLVLVHKLFDLDVARSRRL